MLHWTLIVAYKGKITQKMGNAKTFFELSKNGFTKVAKITLDCSYDRTMSYSQIQFQYINYLLRYANLKISGPF